MSPWSGLSKVEAGMTSVGRRSLRERNFAFIWAMVWPIRAYINLFPYARGKGWLLRTFLFPCFPPAPATLRIPVPSGSSVGVLYRDALGWGSLLGGAFEWAEMTWISKRLRPGDTAVDVGANQGLYTIMLAEAVGAAGRVISIEPVPATRAFAEANVARNQLENVVFVASAVGDHGGFTSLNLSDDTGYTSMVAVSEGKGNGKSIKVPLQTLDDVWSQCGKPDVRFMKIDVEGAETMVLRGATSLLSTCRPLLLMEANTSDALGELETLLKPMGYSFFQPTSFAAHNYMASTD